MILVGNSMWTSPYVLACFVAMREKGLAFEMQTIALHQGAQREASYATQSLTARVPLFIDGGFALSESSAIIEYLEEAYPAPAHAPLLPAALHTRARARQIMAWLRSDLLPIREERSSEYVFYPHAALEPFAPLSPAALSAVSKLLGAAEQLIPSDSGPMFGAWCSADTDLAMMLQRLLKTGHALPDKVRRYAELQWQRPAVREFAEHVRPPYVAS